MRQEQRSQEKRQAVYKKECILLHLASSLKMLLAVDAAPDHTKKTACGGWVEDMAYLIFHGVKKPIQEY